MPVNPPTIDYRNQQDVVRQLRRLVLHYCPEWKNITSIESDKQADALIHIFARMVEMVIQRLNKVPDKNFLAFLDLVGVRQSPPHAARAPLIFTISAGAGQYGFVPAGTQVAAAPQKKDQEPVVFETEKDLTVILPKLIKAVSLNPADDQWADHSEVFFGKTGKLGKNGNGVEIFKGNEPIPHRLYLGHSKLFSFKEPASITLDITLHEETKGDIDLAEWEVKWYCFTDDSSEPKPLAAFGKNASGGEDAEVVNLLKSGSITFEKISGISERTLTGFEKEENLPKSWKSNWIFAELNNITGKAKVFTDFSKIKTIKAGLKITPAPSSLFADLAFFNNFPLDLTKDFYPFGEKPGFNDTFYISSKEVFSKEGAMITIKVALSEGVALPDPQEVALGWEFWDGKSWMPLGETTKVGVDKKEKQGSYLFTDSTKAFTCGQAPSPPEQVTFTCPKIEVKEIKGEENYWIRIRIVGGNYGVEATYEETTTTGEKSSDKKTTDGGSPIAWKYIPPTFRPPSISSLTLAYDQFDSPKENLEVVLAFNNFIYREQTKTDRAKQDQTQMPEAEDNYFTPFQPFQLMEDRQPALYLAFDGDISTLPVTIFFPLRENIFGSYQGIKDQGIPRITVVAWEYWTGKEWTIFSVEDGTRNFTRRGMVEFVAPNGMARGSFFGEKHYWIRARLEGGHTVPPRLSAIYTNTVWAHSMITMFDEILGSSNGNPGQSFTFSHSPILPGQALLVKEIALTEEERQKICSEEGADAVTEVPDEAGNIIETWIRWHEVDNFHFSEPSDRHYIIDRLSGKVTFGDAKKGMIPLAGKDTIKCSRYQYGGGAEGNVGAGTITELKTTFPYIDSVTNPEAADGGLDQEDLDRARIRGPQVIKHRERAVTYEDFEWLVREASSKVSKVKCLPTTDTSLQFKPGWVTIIVVPESEDAKPLPSQELLSEIKEYLSARTSTCLTAYPPYPSQINLIGPGYIRVAVTASVKYTSISAAKIIESRIIDHLKRFLHPLYGGPEKNGWDFGRNVYISEIYELIENTEGVDYVEDLSLKASVQTYTLTLKENMTPSISYPKLCPVTSTTNQGKITFLLTERLSPGKQITTLPVAGFKEGDCVTLTLMDGVSNPLSLMLTSVSGNKLECENFRTDIEYPIGSIVKTQDQRIKSYLCDPVPANMDISSLKVAIFGRNEVAGHNDVNHNDVILSDRDCFHHTGHMEIIDVSDQVETIYIEDNCLVYSGTHVMKSSLT